MKKAFVRFRCNILYKHYTEYRIEVAKQFIGYRSRTIYDPNGTVERHRTATYEEYLQSDNYKSYQERYAPANNPRKGKGGVKN